MLRPKPIRLNRRTRPGTHDKASLEQYEQVRCQLLSGSYQEGSFLSSVGAGIGPEALGKRACRS